MALSGETIDYGPCAFLDTYHPETVFSSIDRGGRYAYGNQPDIAHWNLARLAEALLPLIDKDQEKAVAAAEELLSKFPKEFRKHHEAGLHAKLGLLSLEEGDGELSGQLLDVMQTSGADFTSTFVALSKSVDSGQVDSAHLNSNPTFLKWHERWATRLERQNHTKDEVTTVMKGANPVIIPRNHRVEEALAAAQTGDLNVLRRLLEILANPFEETEENDPYRTAPSPRGVPYQTFCGT